MESSRQWDNLAHNFLNPLIPVKTMSKVSELPEQSLCISMQCQLQHPPAQLHMAQLTVALGSVDTVKTGVKTTDTPLFFLAWHHLRASDGR